MLESKNDTSRNGPLPAALAQKISTAPVARFLIVQSCHKCVTDCLYQRVPIVLTLRHRQPPARSSRRTVFFSSWRSRGRKLKKNCVVAVVQDSLTSYTPRKGGATKTAPRLAARACGCVYVRGESLRGSNGHPVRVKVVAQLLASSFVGIFFFKAEQKNQRTRLNATRVEARERSLGIAHAPRRRRTNGVYACTRRRGEDPIPASYGVSRELRSGSAATLPSPPQKKIKNK